MSSGWRRRSSWTRPSVRRWSAHSCGRFGLGTPSGDAQRGRAIRQQARNPDDGPERLIPDPTDLQQPLGAFASAEAPFEIALQLLGRLPRVRAHAATLFIAQQGEELHDLGSTLANRWGALLSHVLSRGWDIECLVRLPTDPARLQPLVQAILELAGESESFHIRYFSEPAPLPVPYSLIIAPPRFALLGLATHQDRTVDSLARLVEPATIVALRDHFFQLRRRTRPLFTIYARDQRLSFEEDLNDAARHEAPYAYLVKDGLSNVTIPRSWAHEDSAWIRSRATEGVDARILAATLEERLELAERFASRRPLRTICPVSAIARWIDEGLDGRDVQPQGGFAATPTDRVARLENVITVLENWSHFELGLWHEADGRLPPAYWQLFGDRVVFVSGWHALPHDRWRAVHLKISHPAVVAAFALHFEHLWQRLPRSQRSKRTVADELRLRLASTLSDGEEPLPGDNPSRNA